jgi:hypothetical protein
MADDTITDAEREGLVPPEVRAVLAEESEFIAAKVRRAQGTWDKTIASGLTWLPYVGDVFEENSINTAAATSDVVRSQRVKIVVDKIEKALNAKLSENTIDGIRGLVEEMYNTDIDLDKL